MKEYDYNVIFTGNYWSLTTRISIELDDTTGNLSDEAREQAEERANEAIRGELGIDPINFAHSINVSLLLDNEEIWLDGLGEFPAVHVEVIEGECDKCANSYELSSRDDRCGNCGNCNTCCTHEREGK